MEKHERIWKVSSFDALICDFPLFFFWSRPFWSWQNQSKSLIKCVIYWILGIDCLSCYVNEAYAIVHAMLWKSCHVQMSGMTCDREVRCFREKKKSSWGLACMLVTLDALDIKSQVVPQSGGARGSRTLPLRVFNSTSVYLKRNKGKSLVRDEVFVLNL